MAEIIESKQHNLETIRHSWAHVLAEAVLRIIPKAKIGMGPAIEDGFYYDFDLPETLTPEILPKIEAEMAKIVKEDQPFEREEMIPAEAQKLFEKIGQNYKVEIVEDLVRQGEKKVSVYRSGDFVDLCRGPHIESTGNLDPKTMKLARVAGAYWKGSENNKMLQRIYGFAFPTAKELRQHIAQIAEAEKRDHRVIGKNLGLFFFHPDSVGCVYWQPKGFIIFNALEKYWREEHRRRGYNEIMTPQLFRKELWEQSGHWEHYRDDMFHWENEKSEVLGLKPMDCPDACVVYKNEIRSYRDLPIRLNEIGRIFRNERSGTLNGLFRVRQITQDDAHIFCRPDQIQEEISGVIKFVKDFYRLFDFEVNYYLSTKPDKAMGDSDLWRQAEEDLAKALDINKIKYDLKPKDGAFYGPKIDVQINDAMGREWQMATIQLDFQLPERFELDYVDESGRKKRPVIIHRVIFGSFERFIGILTEELAGAFPVWLAPVQVQLISVAEDFADFANEIEAKISAAGVRVEVDNRDESVGKKISEAISGKVPYSIVIGEKEKESGVLPIRDRGGKISKIKLEEFIDKIKVEIKEKNL